MTEYLKKFNASFSDMLSHRDNVSFKYLFSAMWIKNSAKTDMHISEEEMENFDRFESYNLTPRQKEIALLLLNAKTRSSFHLFDI